MRWALVLVVACDGQTHGTRVSNAVPDPGPHLTLDANGRIVAEKLPASSADGTLAVVVHRIPDPRGGETVSLRLLDRDDHAISEIAAAPLDPANLWLRDLHDKKTLVAMSPMVDEIVDSITLHHRARWDGLAIDWEPGKLAITVGAAAPITRATPPTWVVADAPLYAGATEVCHWPAYLQQAHVDKPHHLAVIAIAFIGSDTCPEPPARAHVVTW